MADYDYAPVASPDEEEELRRRDAEPEDKYPPVGGAALPQPINAPTGGATAPMPMPIGDSGVGSKSALDSALAVPTPAVKLGSQRPQWKDYAPAESHGWGKFGHIMAGLSPLTNSVFNVMPEQRAERKYRNATSEYESGERDQLTEAQTDKAKADAEKARKEAEGAGKPKPKEESWEVTPHFTGPNGEPVEVEKNSGQMRVGGKEIPGIKGTAPKPEKPDNPEQQYVDEYQKTHPGSTIAQAQRAFKLNEHVAENPADKRNAAEQVQVEREARTAVHKAEQDYNNARSTVAMQRELIKEAKGGNKEAVRMVPLEGALEITTSQGVHRINKTEVEQYGHAGSLYDKIVGAIGGGVSGKNIPDSVLNDMDAMTKELSKNAHERYKREYDYNKQVVEGYGGKDFDKRVPMVKAEEEGQSAKDFGAAPAGKADGSTGTLPDGTKVVVKGGRLISQ